MNLMLNPMLRRFLNGLLAINANDYNEGHEFLSWLHNNTRVRWRGGERPLEYDCPLSNGSCFIYDPNENGFYHTSTGLWGDRTSRIRNEEVQVVTSYEFLHDLIY